MSFAAMVPFAGTAATIAKVAGTVKDVIDKSKDSKGVYDLIVKNADDLEQAYVGQSKNIYKRMQRHFGKSGKLKMANEVIHGVTHKMPGSIRKEREIYEQFIIFKKYGADLNRSSKFHQLINKVNPVGGRYNMKTKEGQDKLVEKAQELAKRWNLPTDFEPIILN